MIYGINKLIIENKPLKGLPWIKKSIKYIMMLHLWRD
jgi:hypothetical protein